MPDGWFSALPRERERLRERRLLDERFLLLDRLRSFLRRERLRLRLRERLLLPSASFSALLERERLLLFETEEASESSSRAIFFFLLLFLVCRGDGVCERAERAVGRRELSSGAVELWSCGAVPVKELDMSAATARAVVATCEQ